MIYLSPVYHSLKEDDRPKFGYIQNLYKGGVGQGIKAGHLWLLDNGAFSSKWTEEKWPGALNDWRDYASTCIAAVCPDVVGDAAATVALFGKYEPVIREYGYKVAFVTQDGLRMEDVPWDRFEVLFVGGTNQHKLKESYPFIYEAKARGKWVHIGRVSSIKRMLAFWMADSCDGAILWLDPGVAPRLLRGVEMVKAKRQTAPLPITSSLEFTDYVAQHGVNPEDDAAYNDAFLAYRLAYGDVSL